ncbi:MAG: DUF4175 family protein, partial [Rhodospirillales bacterium]
VATGVTILFLLYRELSRVRLPGAAEADRRLEAASGLSHRPLSVVTGRPRWTDATSLALWEAHRARAAAQIAHLKIGTPRPGLARRDRRALRAGLVVGLVACGVVAGRDAPSRVVAALVPLSLPAVATISPELRAWIAPPAYTGLPPIFLRPDVAAVSVPIGSHLTINLTAATGIPTLVLDGKSERFQTLATGSFQAERDIAASGTATIQSGDGSLGQWLLTAIEDRPPNVRWASPPGRAQESQQTRLPWQTEDDYGVVALRTEFRLEARQGAPASVAEIPLPGGRTKAARGVAQQDLTAHPWAGLSVVATLIAQDYPGQIGRSDPVVFVLPERLFLNPIAQALIQVRKGLSLHPDDRGDEMEILDRSMQNLDAFGDDLSAVLNLAGIYFKLVRSQSDADIAEAQERLWQLALHMEEGQTEATARALEEARDAAREALAAMLQDPSKANRDKLDETLQALKEAIDRHMQALQQEAERNGEAPKIGADAKTMTERELDRQTDRTRDAAQSGTPQDAQERMAALERMLDRLRNAKPGQQDKQNAEQRQRGRQQMGAVQDMVGREGGLLDRTEGRVDQTTKRLAPPNGADADAAREADRRVQQALRRSLGELMQQFGDLTGEIPPSLGEAERAMRDAATALGQGRDKVAGDAVQQAVEALQKGAQEMGQAMAKKFGSPRPGTGEDEGDGDAGMFGMTMPGGRQAGRSDGSSPSEPGRPDSRGRDPLGRSTGNGTAGSEEGGDTTVPEERERQRTLAIQEELRRREAEKTRPQPELDYIERLLKQF